MATTDQQALATKAGTVVIRYKDEWPLRVGEFILYLSEWYAAHPKLVNTPSSEIASFLDGIAFEEGIVHQLSSGCFDRDVTGKTTNTVEYSIDFKHFCLTLASAAFERYFLTEFMGSGCAVC